jgi:hypothetical protein
VKGRLPPNLQYQALMTNVRARFEVIDGLKVNEGSGFAELETAAFHLRKSIEGIAFGCLVAMEQGLKEVPRDAIGQWNADNIFIRLKRRDQLVFPESFKRENPPLDSDPKVSHHIVPRKEANLSIDEVRDIYRRSHKWLIEWNPYIERIGKDFGKSRADLLRDIQSVWQWIVAHMIGIGGHVFLAFLKDGDGHVRVVSAESMN